MIHSMAGVCLARQSPTATRRKPDDERQAKGASNTNATTWPSNHPTTLEHRNNSYLFGIIMKFFSCQLLALLAFSAQDVSSFAPYTVGLSNVASATSTSPSALWMGDESRATDNRQDIPQSVLLDMHGTLASLFGSDHKRASFYTHQYGADKRTPDNVVHLPRDKIMDIAPPVKGCDIKSLYETNDHISLRIRGSRDTLDKNEMSYEAFEEYIRLAGSAIVPIIEGDYLFKFRQDLEKVFSESLSVNVYHSGIAAEALTKHYDQCE